MFFGKKNIVYPFSGFEGHLTHKGQPAGGAIVKRTYDWDGEMHEETVMSDENGFFRFDSVAIETRESLTQFVSSQRIYVTFESVEYETWVCGKIAQEEYGEFGGKPINLTCELTDDLKALELPRGYVGTNCRWTIGK